MAEEHHDQRQMLVLQASYHGDRQMAADEQHHGHHQTLEEEAPYHGQCQMEVEAHVSCLAYPPEDLPPHRRRQLAASFDEGLPWAAAACWHCCFAVEHRV